MEDPLLSDDLEWMLQSGQASPEMLAAALVGEYYQPLHRLASAVLNDGAAAHYVAIRTFVVALGEVHRYRSGDGLRMWLYRLSVPILARTNRMIWFERQAGRLRRKVTGPVRSAEGGEGQGFSEYFDSPARDAALWQVFAKLPFQARLAAALAFIEGWPAGELCRLLRITEPRLERSLERFRRILQPGEPAAGSDLANSALLAEDWNDLPEDRLRAAARRAWPMAPLAGHTLDAVTRTVLAQGTQRRGGLVRRSRLGEAVLVLLLAASGAGLVWTLNSLDPELAAQRFIAQTRSAEVRDATESGASGSEEPRSSAVTAPPPGSTPTRAPLTAFYYIQPGDTIESVASSLGVTPERLAALNRSRIEDLLISGQALRVQIEPSEPVPPVYRPRQSIQQQLAPLDRSAESLTVYLFLSASEALWRSLWADATFTNYGPPGYLGPPYTARSQIWVQQPDSTRVLAGSSMGDFMLGGMSRGSLTYYFNLEGYASVSRGPQPLASSVFRESIFPSQSDWLNLGGTFIPVTEERHGTRWAVVFDWITPQGVRTRRLWIDSEMGTILRFQRFDERDGTLLLSDANLDRVIYDVRIDPALFDPTTPWPQRFVSDYRGVEETGAPTPTPAPLLPERKRAVDYPSAPPDYDPAGVRLAFVYDLNNDPLGNQVVRLVAEGFELSVLTLGSPWVVSCTRSPDGSKLAYVTNMGSSSSAGGARTAAVEPGLFWLDLYRPNLTRFVSTTGYVPSVMAFSPDSRYLAYYNSRRVVGEGVHIFDTQTGNSRLLLEIDSVDRLAWSPDGEVLAITGGRRFAELETLQVRVLDGEILAREPAGKGPTPLERLGGPNGPSLELPFGPGSLGACTYPD